MMDNFYNQSVVCYYYSALQRMMYILAETASNSIAYASQARIEEDKHSWLCERIKERIPNSQYRSQFADAFEQLRENRKLADYGQKIFTKEECLEMKELATRTIEKLRYVR